MNKHSIWLARKKDEGMNRTRSIERKEKEKSREQEGEKTCRNWERENIEVNREEGENTWRDRERKERKQREKNRVKCSNPAG